MKNFLIYINCRSKKTSPVDLEQHIHDLGEFISHEDCLWIIRSDKSEAELLDSFADLVDDWDVVFVAELGKAIATNNWGSKDIARMRDYFEISFPS